MDSENCPLYLNMICLDCVHALIRTSILMDREEHELICDVIGAKVVINFIKCNRHAIKNAPASEIREPVWNKGKDKRRG